MTIELETRVLGIPVRRDRLQPGDQIPLGAALSETELTKIDFPPKKHLAALDRLSAMVLNEDTVQVELKRGNLHSDGKTVNKALVQGNEINRAKIDIHLEQDPPYCQMLGGESLPAHVWLHELHLPNLVNNRVRWRKTK